MFLRELSNAEAPEGRAARYDKLCSVYERYWGWSAKSANCIRVGIGAIYRIARF
jgi:hypothetical protein